MRCFWFRPSGALLTALILMATPFHLAAQENTTAKPLWVTNCSNIADPETLTFSMTMRLVQQKTGHRIE